MQTLLVVIGKSARFIAAAVMASILYAVYSISYHAGLHSLQEEAGRSLEKTANALFASVEKYGYFPEVVASQPIALETLLNKSNPEYIGKANAYLENINQIAKAEAIYILDINGQTIAASNWSRKNSFVGKNYTFRPYFQDAIKGGTGKFYALGTTSKTPGYYISCAIKFDGKIIGVAVVKVDLSNFDREWHDRNNYEVTVSDEYGINFLSSQPDWKYRPMQKLASIDLENLKNTRKYDTSLKSPLPSVERKSLGANSEYLRISQPDAAGRRIEVPYVVTTGKLSWSAWNMNIFMPADEIQGRALRYTAAAAVLMTLVLLVLLYWSELRRRVVDREKAKAAIEAAHAELEFKHRQLEVLSDELRRLASVDELTDSYNRRFFFEITAKMLSAVLRHNLPLSIIVIDVDFFKRINDEYGHLAGDRVLRQISRICSFGLREEDVFARLGGEEFVMALMPTAENDAMEIAERLRLNVMTHRFVENGSAINVTISCGVAQYQPFDVSIEGTILRADNALYEAKQSGRNQIAAAKTMKNGAAKTTHLQ